MCMEDFGATAFACTPSYALYLAEAANEAGIVDKLQLKSWNQRGRAMDRRDASEDRRTPGCKLL